MGDDALSGAGPVFVHELATAPDGSATVVVVHGITANGLAFEPLAQRLAGQVGIWAPDLRGRADSQPGPPYGLGVHADDVIAVLEQLGRRRNQPTTVLVGHSMGAFVCSIVAARRPDLVRSLILVDGGLAFPLSTEASSDVDAMITAVIGPAMQRLTMTFASPEDYLAYWAAHPALAATIAATTPAAEAVRAYLLHDLVPDGAGAFRSSCVLEAIRADGAMTLTDSETHSAPAAAVAAGVPTSLWWAPRGLADEAQGLYDEQRLAALNLPVALETHQVPDVNHYTVLFADHARDLLAHAIGAAVTR